MKKLLIYLKDYKKESVLAPLFKMLEATFELFVPLVMASIIDIGIAGNDKPFIYKRIGILLGLALIGLICSLTAQFFAAKAAVGFAAKMKSALYRHIQSLSFSELDEIGTATLITRMTSDANQVQNCVNMVLRLFLRSPFIVFGAMIMAFTIDVKAALIFVVTIPVLSVVVFGIMMITIPLYKKVQGALDRVLGKTRENLTGVRVLRAFHKEEDEVKEFDIENSTLTVLQNRVGRISALMNPITYIVVNIATVVLIYSGAIRVNIGTLSQGSVVALVNYMSQILVELIKLANLIVLITKALACANRIQTIFETKPEMIKAENLSWRSEDCPEYRPDSKIRFEKVSLAYRGAGDEALSGIDFEVKKGQTIGIIGGTGCGKSSVVNLIPRFYDTSVGTVRVDGIDVRKYPIATLRRKVGMVLQKAALFEGTIRENLRWGDADATDEELWEALRISQAEEFVKEKEGQLDEKVTQGGRNLSGGQRQRLTIARALVKKPEILILDDSASALDYATDAKLRRAIHDMNGDTTVFIVSQRTASIMDADLILVLDDGKLVGKGVHKELLENCMVYREIYESQFRKEEA